MKNFSVGRIVAGALVFASAAFSTYAAELTLTLNGQPVEKTVSQITFDGDNVVLHFLGGSETATHDMADVAFVLSASSGIQDLGTYTFNGKVGDDIVISGVAAGTPVEVYDIAGRLHMTSSISSTEGATVNISSLAPGFYILRAGKSVVKFKK